VGKTIQTPAVITSIRSRQDMSVGFSAETPEYSDEEFAHFRNLQGKSVKMTIEPTEEKTEILEIKTELDEKTPGQRLRAVLYRHWEKFGKERGMDKDVYYKIQMEKVIDQFKAQLD
jgi:hypothetical protein